MAAKKRIILHVGSRKSGSTYLQKRLKANTEPLRQQRVAYPLLRAVSQMAGNAKLIPMAIDGKAQPVFGRVFPHINVPALDPNDLINQLTRPYFDHADTIILSAENLRSCHARQMRSLLPKNIDCTVVLIVRRQDDWLQSYFLQMLKHQSISEPISGFLAGNFRLDRAKFFWPNWFTQYREWARHFGSCNVLFYDEIKDVLFDEFLKTSNIEPSSDFVDIDSQNLSLSLHETAYLLSLSGNLAFDEFMRHRRSAERAARQLGGGWKRYSLLSRKDRNILRDWFTISNQKLLHEINRTDLSELMEIGDESPDYYDFKVVYQSSEYAEFCTLTSTIMGNQTLS